MQTYEQPERAWLYGDRGAAAQFDRLASLAWQAFLGTRAGKVQYAPAAENDTDRWLTVVYRQLQYDMTAGPNYLQAQDCLVFRLAEGMERIEHAENYALPMTYGPIHDPDDRSPPNGSFDRWRLTELTTDVFNASAAALDMLLSDPDPEGTRVVSWQEMDAYQRSPAFQQANWQIESIIMAQGRHFSVYRRDGKPSTKALPSICPKAEPKLPIRSRVWRSGGSRFGHASFYFGSVKVLGSTLSTGLKSVISTSRNFSPSRLLSSLVAFLMPPKSL
jgi:hypothetical protein